MSMNSYNLVVILAEIYRLKSSSLWGKSAHLSYTFNIGLIKGFKGKGLDDNGE